MPGFLIFEEFGDILGDNQTGMMADMAKKGLRAVPMSWLAHGVIGEFNVDVDPVAELRALTSGDTPGITDFYEAYKGWIAVTNVTHNIPGVAQTDQQDEQALMDEFDGSADGDGTYEALQYGQQQQAAGLPLDRPGVKNAKRKGAARSSMLSGAGLDQITVDVEIDCSLPKLIEWALHEEEEGKKGGKEFKVADLHMCTTAQIDTSQLTLGSNSPAASLIQTLVGAMVFNIIPYLSFRMEKVRIMSIDLNVASDATVPTAQLVLKFNKITWTYHIINGSNMNLFDISFEYEIGPRKKAKSELTLGGVPVSNPFK